MSFGFGVGDFLAVFDLAARIRKQWIDAPTEYTSMKNEVRNIESILRDIDDLRQEIDLSQQQNDDLQHASNSCRDVLEQCSAMIDKYSFATGSKNGTTARMRRTWKRFQSDPDDVRHMRSQLLSLVGQLTALRDAIHIDMLRDAGESVEHINEVVGYVYDDTQALRASDEAQQKDTIAAWFSGSKFADQQNEFMKRRQPGTGRWFLQDDCYQEWSRKEGSAPILLCPGAPGSGKTMMFAGIVKDLCDHYLGRKDTFVIYFYCNFNRKDEQDLEQLYACFVRQMFQGQSSVPEEAKNLYLKHRDHLTRPSVDELLVLLRTLAQKAKQTFILVDALDECNIDRSCRNLLIDELISMAGNQPGSNTKILCTTRPIPEITERFPVCPQIHIRAEEEDLISYLNARIFEISCVNSKADLQETIRSEITRLADGMFLLARLYFDSLLGCTKPKSVRKVLADLPHGREALFQMYDTARARIDHQMKQLRDLAHKVLVWITYARTELTIEQLQEAVAVEPGMIDLDHDDDIDDESVIVSVCAGLVTVDRDTRVVRLMHYTTQEYLLRVRKDWFPNAQKDIAQACLTYLSMDVFQADEWKIQLLPYTQKYKLLLYAGKQWGYHLTNVDDSETNDQAYRFLYDGARLTFASQVLLGQLYLLPLSGEGKKSPSYRCFQQNVSRFHICAYFNMWKICSKIIDTSADSYDLKDSQQKTPLMWAAEMGHKEMLELLLQQPGVDVNSTDYLSDTPLSKATSRRHKTIVELLIQHPAIDVNRADPIYEETALWIAVDKGYKEIVELLLQDPRVNVKLKDQYDITPLRTAVYEGHEEIVELLIRQPGVDVNSKDVWGRTPLSTAIEKGRNEVVELLLRHPGIEVPPELLSEIDEMLRQS